MDRSVVRWFFSLDAWVEKSADGTWRWRRSILDLTGGYDGVRMTFYLSFDVIWYSYFIENAVLLDAECVYLIWSPVYAVHVLFAPLFLIVLFHLRYFDVVDVCKVRPNWTEVRLGGKFTCGQNDVGAVRMHVFSPTDVDLCLFQKSNRFSINRFTTQVLVCCWEETICIYAVEAKAVRHKSSFVCIPLSCLEPCLNIEAVRLRKQLVDAFVSLWSSADYKFEFLRMMGKARSPVQFPLLL